MAVPSREVGARYCAPVLTKQEVFWPGGVSLSVVGVGSAEHSQPFFLKELSNLETPETRAAPDFP